MTIHSLHVYEVYTKLIVLHIGHHFSAGRGSFLALSAAGRARVYTTAQVWVPAGPRGACSGRSKSRNLASNRGKAFVPARAKQDDGNSHELRVHKILLCCWLLLLYSTMSVSHSPASSVLCGSHETTAVAHQALLSMTPTDGAACVYACAYHFPFGLGSTNERIRSLQKGAIHWVLLKGAGR